MLNKNKSRKVPKAFTGFKGTELIDKIIDIDQSPIGRTPGQILLLIQVRLDNKRVVCWTSESKARG